MASSLRPMWTTLIGSGLIVLLIILLSELMDRRQRKKLVSITDFDRGLIYDEKNRLRLILEILRRYLRQESLEFLDEVDIEIPHHPVLKQESERRSGRRSNRDLGSVVGKKSGGITLKKHTQLKSHLSTKTSSTVMKRHSLSLRFLFILVFVSGLTLARYYFLSVAMREPIFLFNTFRSLKDIYLGLIASQMSLSALAIYNSGDTIHYKHPIQFFNDELATVVNHAVPNLLNLAKVNSDLKTGQMLEGLLYNWQFCDMLQLTAENDYLYQNCESALGGITKNTMAAFIQQYPILLSQYVARWSLETTQAGKDVLLKGEEFGSLFAFSVYNQFGTMDAIYYHFMLPLITQINAYLASSLLVVALTNLITGLFGTMIIVVSFRLVYSIAKERFAQVPKIIVSVPIRLLLSNPHFRLLAKNIQSKGSFWGMWM